MYRRLISSMLAFALLFTLAFLSGCGSKEKNETGSASSLSTESTTAKETKKEEPKVTVRLFVRYGAGTLPIDAAFKARKEEFIKQNPNITVDDMSISEGKAYDDKLKTMIATGDVPEICTTYGGEGERGYAENKVFENLVPFFEKDKEWYDAFLPLFDNWQFDGLDGVYGVPSEFMATGIFYNDEIFKKTGLTPPQTMEELQEVAPKLKEAGYIPMALGAKSDFRGGQFFSNMLYKRFSFDEILDICTTRNIKYTDTAIVDLLKMIDELNKAEVFGPNAIAVDQNQDNALFFSEKSAMHFDGTWFAGNVVESPIKDKIKFMPFPYFKDYPQYKDNWFGGAGAGFSLSAKADDLQKDAAFKLIKFLVSKEAFESYRQEIKAGFYPSKLSESSDLDPIVTNMSNVINTGKLFKPLYVRFDKVPTMRGKVFEGIQGIISGKSAEAVAGELVKEIEKQAK